MAAGLFLLAVRSGDGHEREASSVINQSVEWTLLAMSIDRHSVVIFATSSGGSPRPKEGGQPWAEPCTEGGGGSARGRGYEASARNCATPTGKTSNKKTVGP